MYLMNLDLFHIKCKAVLLKLFLFRCKNTWKVWPFLLTLIIKLLLSSFSINQSLFIQRLLPSKLFLRSHPPGRPDSACSPEVPARHRHVAVHHGAPGRRRAHPAVPFQFTCSGHNGDHGDLPEPALHRKQRGAHVPGSHLLVSVEMMAEEEKKREKTASCVATAAPVCVDRVSGKIKLVSSSALPPFDPVPPPLFLTFQLYSHSFFN